MYGVKDIKSKTVEYLPLTGAQQWLMGELLKYKRPGWVCLEFMIKTKQPMNEFAMKEAAWYLVARYENLRVKIYHKDGRWVQELYPLTESNIYSRYDLSQETPEEQQVKMREICIKERDWLLPGRGNVIRILYFKFSEKEGRIWFCVHHVVSDFVSMLILSGDYMNAYNTIVQGRELKRQAVTDYRKWMYILNGYARDVVFPAQYEYWISLPWEKAKLLPGDYPDQFGQAEVVNEVLRTKQWLHQYKTYHLALPQSDTLKLLGRYGLEFEAILIAVFFMAMSNHRKVDCLDIAASHAGRNLLPAEYEVSEHRLVGYISLVRVLLLTNPGYGNATRDVHHVAEQIKNIPHGGTGFAMVIDYIRQDGLREAYCSLRKNPQIFFNYLGATNTQGNNEAYEMVQEDIGQNLYPPEIKDSIFECSAAINQGQLNITLTYIETYMKESTTAGILQLMVGMLRTLVSEQETEKAI